MNNLLIPAAFFLGVAFILLISFVLAFRGRAAAYREQIKVLTDRCCKAETGHEVSQAALANALAREQEYLHKPWVVNFTPELAQDMAEKIAFLIPPLQG